jgi:hypothetical protein
MTQQPYPVKKKSPWIWVSLGCIGIVAILGVILIVATRNFLSSDEGKQFMAGMDRTQDYKEVLPIVASGMQKYVTEKGDFPENLDALSGYVESVTLAKVKKEMKYTKPAKDAPAETVVLTTGEHNLIKGSTQEIVLTKDFQMRQRMDTPLEDS